MSTLSSDSSQVLQYPPSCISFCPQHPRFFVVGTYFLHRRDTVSEETSEQDVEAPKQPPAEDETVQRRTGSLILFLLTEGKQIAEEISTTPTDFAVLDAQWTPHIKQSGSLLAVAASTGQVSIFELRFTSAHAQVSGDRSATLHLRTVYQIAGPETLILSLAWHPQQHDTLGVTLSTGEVKLCTSTSTPLWLDVMPPGMAIPFKLATHPTHSLEAWTMTFASVAQGASTTSTLVLSGGDDAHLIASRPTPVGAMDTIITADEGHHDNGDGDGQDPSSALWQDRGRIHNAGITAILPLPTSTYTTDGSFPSPSTGQIAARTQLIVTGSYDDHIRLLAAPAISGTAVMPRSRVQTLAEANLGGGVWRLKLLEHRVHESAASRQVMSEQGGMRSMEEYVLLASCMHAGARVVGLSRSLTAGASTGDKDQSDAGGEGSEWTFEVLARFEEHASMNYGSDARRLVNDETNRLLERSWTVVSTSFYDRLLCVWQLDLEDT